MPQTVIYYVRRSNEELKIHRKKGKVNCLINKNSNKLYKDTPNK